jgi:hypothetical protein
MSTCTSLHSFYILYWWPAIGHRRAAVTAIAVLSLRVMLFQICKLDGNSELTCALPLFHNIIAESRTMRS